ncbi:MAG: proteasome endopeptidase complex, archaeal, alpha subunit [Methanosphaera sp. rholeuAM130]|nr:archaeal proteasome endopeptidase complex subunit alpha [Methanosphaera sp.]RAP52961.1 MAG: proteasome endopeptidase complex, archaeal, alpha subunit [Methanosphaera sp. rholeuAM130]
MQQFQSAGYDRALTLFSPDGRLFQIEYAREAVKRGTTAIGIKSKDGVIFAVDKKIKSKLIEPTSVEKIFKIDEHIATASSGLVADARRLVDIARNQAQVNRLRYHEPISVTGLAKYLGDLEQMYTQSGGVRPFGISLIIGGVSDDECKIYETDPSGAIVEYKATAIGLGRDKALDLFEEKYEDDISIEDAIDLAIDGIYEANGGKVTQDSIEISIIDKETAKYGKVPEDEVEVYVKKLLDRKEEERLEAERKAEEEREEKEARKAQLKAERQEQESQESEESSTDEETKEEDDSEDQTDE